MAGARMGRIARWGAGPQYGAGGSGDGEEW